MTALGIIGGSGIYDLDFVAQREIVEVDTPFGSPSGPIITGLIAQTRVFFLARHGAGHCYSPSDLPYRANVYALKSVGATHVLSLSAVGSLREALPPRTLVVPDQIIDRTVGRPRTYFEGGVVAHVGLADPFCRDFSDQLEEAANNAGLEVARGGSYVCIEGPQFSTRAESALYRSWGAAVIGMTAMPEARLAREAELCYAMLAMVTDYDVWHEEEADVSVEVVVSNLLANSQAASAIIRDLSATGLRAGECHCGSVLAHAIVTDQDRIPDHVRERIELFAGRYFANDQ